MLARQAVAQFGEAVVGGADTAVPLARYQGQVGAVRTATAPVVVQVAVQGDAGGVDTVARRGGAPKFVVELLVVVVQVEKQVGQPRAQDRIVGVNPGAAGGAFGVQPRELGGNQFVG